MAMKKLKTQFAAARMNREAETQKKNLNPRTFLLDDMILEWLGLRLEPLRRLLETATRPMLVHMPLTESSPAILTPFQPSAFLPSLLRTVNDYWSHLRGKSRRGRLLSKRWGESVKKELNPPKCFVSYTWDSPAHESWVLGLATQLRENGVDVVLDKWDLEFGNDLHHFMETSVRESDFVVIICTSNYARKANAGSGGAGYEKQIVTGEMFQGANPSKFIPLVRSGPNGEALPSFLKSKNYIDFRDDSKFDGKLKDLLHQLHRVPKYPRPNLGPSPFSSRPQASPTPARSTKTTPGTPGLPPHLEMAMQLPKATDGSTSPMHGEINLVIEKLKVVGPDPTASGLRII